MTINGINNTVTPFDTYQKYTPIGKTPTTQETPTNPLIEDKKINAKNTAVNKTITENKNNTNLVTKSINLSTFNTANTENTANTANPSNTASNTNISNNLTKPTLGLQKDQQQTANYINNVQKTPNGMDNIAQAMIQGYKGVNRLA